MLPKEIFPILPKRRTSIGMNYVRWHIHQRERTRISLFNLIRRVQSIAISAEVPTSSTDCEVSLEVVQVRSLIQDAVQKTNGTVKRALILKSLFLQWQRDHQQQTAGQQPVHELSTMHLEVDNLQCVCQ